MIAHLVQIRVFSTPEDKLEDVYEKLVYFLPFDLYENKININKKNAVGFNNREITIFSVSLTKKKLMNEFLDNIVDKLSRDQRDLIIKNASKQIDDNLDFFMRFDKKMLIKENKLLLIKSGDCYHIRISLAVFPKNKENAIKLIKEIFSKAI